jgi:hypothetical protein
VFSTRAFVLEVEQTFEAVGACFRTRVPAGAVVRQHRDRTPVTFPTGACNAQSGKSRGIGQALVAGATQHAHRDALRGISGVDEGGGFIYVFSRYPLPVFLARRQTFEAPARPGWGFAYWSPIIFKSEGTRTNRRFPCFTYSSRPARMSI